VPAPRDLHRDATRLLSGVMVVLGVAILVSTIARGGGPLATGILLGVLFLAAGVGRLYVERARGHGDPAGPDEPRAREERGAGGER
jgi:hypothetical protein